MLIGHDLQVYIVEIRSNSATGHVAWTLSICRKHKLHIIRGPRFYKDHQCFCIWTLYQFAKVENIEAHSDLLDGILWLLRN